MVFSNMDGLFSVFSEIWMVCFQRYGLAVLLSGIWMVCFQNTYLQSLMCSQPRPQPRPAAQEHGHNDVSCTFLALPLTASLVFWLRRLFQRRQTLF